MENLLPCPFCGGKAELENWKLACEEIGTIISCAVCDACVSEGVEDGNGWRERAVKKWNRRAQQEQPNEPLTLEELREMDGEVEPVFVMWRPDEDHGFAEDRWYVCGDNFRGVLDNANDGHLFDDYGKTWLAYRRKPEQGV